MLTIWLIYIAVIFLVDSMNSRHVKKDSRIRGSLDRIIGGKKAEITRYPYHVALLYDEGEDEYEYGCGGSLIRADTVLTAAHCVDGLSSDEIQVNAGSKYVHKGGHRRSVSNIIIHDEYRYSDERRKSRNTPLYDVAILILKKPFKISKKIRTIKLAKTDLHDGELVTITGWGKNGKGNYPKALQKVKIPTVNQKQCIKAYKGRRITSTMLCGGYMNGKKDSCTNDSGGPLAKNKTLYGITSWGYGCAVPRYPGVYTRITAVRKWILSTLCSLSFE